jgi:CHRD domain-containing protein
MRIVAPSVVLTLAFLIGSAHFAATQDSSMGMAMATNTLFVAQLDAKQVVGGSASRATGTGAFVLDPEKRALQYSLTYQGLESGGAKSIALYNFDKGKNGEAVKVLCGQSGPPCPSGNSATITGNVERGDGRALDNNLIGEFDSGRVYVEIIGNDGRAEIRGQLGLNGAMVMVANYIVNLAPLPGVDSKGNGTAIVSETYLPGGKTSVFYAATVAGTSGSPTNVTIGGNPTPAERAVTPRAVLPQLKLNLSRDRETGGSLSGSYQVNTAAPDAVLASRLLRTSNGQSGLVVTTSRFPKGELYGALVPVK